MRLSLGVSPIELEAQSNPAVAPSWPVAQGLECRHRATARKGQGLWHVKLLKKAERHAGVSRHGADMIV